MAAPYHAPILGSSAHLRCSACQDVITNNPKARVGKICQECAYVTCGKCTPGQAHTRFCERLGFARTPHLLGRVFGPVIEEKPDLVLWDDGMLFGFQVADFIGTHFLVAKPELQQDLLERLRSPEAFERLLAERVGLSKVPGGQDRPTLAEAAFRARPMALGAGDLGSSNVDYLFFALAVMAQPNNDTFAQYTSLWTNFKIALGVRAAAFTRADTEFRQLFNPEALEHHRQVIMELSPQVSLKGQHVVVPRGFPWESGFRFRERLGMEVGANQERHSQLNVAFYMYLLHTGEDEVNQITLEGKYKGKQRDDASTRWPRRASFDLVLRVMGDPHEAKFATYLSAAGLYSLDTWAKGDLHPSSVKRLADLDKAARAEDFSDGLRFRPAGTTEAEWLASLLTHWVEAKPAYAGGGEKFLDAADLWRFADDVDALLDPDSNESARKKAYQKLTGIKWPLPLSAFVLTLARADLTV
jgi:hypothetical protein